MGYDIRVLKASQPHNSELHLSVWEMSRVRDRMLIAGALCKRTDPGDDRCDCLAGDCAIPAYKLTVPEVAATAAEVRRSLLLLQRAGIEEPRDDQVWCSWLRLLGLAARSCGFEVV